MPRPSERSRTWATSRPSISPWAARAATSAAMAGCPRARPPASADPTEAAVRPVRIGCSGWNYDDWRGRLYPEGVGKARWLSRYAEVFDTVEVNSTFYRLASPKAAARWLEQTPPGF